MLIQCDATDDDQVQAVYDQIKNDWDEIDFVVHCIAYAERDDLGGDFSATNRQGFRTALEVSAYTLMPVVGRAAPLFTPSLHLHAAPPRPPGGAVADQAFLIWQAAR